MPLTFTFALSQNQSFELRCTRGTRRLDTTALGTLIKLCEENYYTQKISKIADLKNIGRELYQWLDGKEGWLRQALEDDSEGRVYLNLIQISEAQALNPNTQKIALGLAHLPWELLHDGSRFLLVEANILPVRSVQQRQNIHCGVQNRPLWLIFMATAPEHPGFASLGFEQEEAKILQATKEQPLSLVVEESGSVEGLKNLVQSYPENDFDVFHLTGHGGIYTEKALGRFLPAGKKIKENTPCFITEDDVGGVVLTTAEDLGKAFGNRFPRVIFLSGCRTGQLADGGTVPSMAQALVKAGAGVVLGWARPVLDTTGIVAATALYQALATGETVEDAIISAHQEMLAQKCPDWHLLRIYRDTRQIAELVTPLRMKGRKKLKLAPAEQEFLDDNKIVKVANRFEFVGRRRALQRCLKALQETSDEVGVFIAGMGGLGKSSLAARLCTRVQSQRDEFERVVLVGVVDEVGLINKLANKYQRFADVPALLNEPGISLQGRLQNFFEAVEKQHEKPLLLVLDDFEQNIPEANIADGSLRMTAAAYGVLAAICAALAENQAESRLIVTCRYLQEDTLPPHRLHLERLAGMGEADIYKIVRDLDKEVKEEVRENRIIQIADGNPRLLTWLLDVVKQRGIAVDVLLTKLEVEELRFRENILAETLLSGLEDGERKFLAQLSVFRLPVTGDIVASTSYPSGGERETREILTKLTSLSLVESATVYATQQPEYRVMTILEPLLQPVLTPEEWQTTKKAATASIYKTWWEDVENYNEEQAREIVRLGVLAEAKEIAVTVGDVIATKWVNRSRYLEALELCQEILQLGEDYRILGTIAIAEVTLGLVEEALQHYQKALALCPEDDVKEKSSILHNMAALKAQQGDIEEAIALYDQSLEIEESINNVRGKAATLHNMAGLKAQQGEIEEAIALYDQSLEIKESINDVRGKAATLHEMAGLKAQQGEIEEAIALYDQSLEIEESINDVRGKAATLHEMAGLKAQQGEIEEAIALYDQSLEIKESINDVRGKAATLHEMAGLKAQQGEIEEAIALYDQSLEIEESINDVRGKAATLHEMAGLKAQQGEIEEAIALYDQSLEIEESINDVRGKAATLHEMAGLKAQQGEIEEAIALYDQSLEIKESINNVRGKAATLHEMAGLKAQQGEIEEAIALYDQSLEIEESINNVRGKAATLHEMAGLKAQQGEIEEAIALYDQSLEIEESINDVRGKAATLHNMAGLKAQQGEIEEAIALYDQSLEIKESINDVRGKAATLHEMAGLKAQQGEIEEAIALYDQSLEIEESINDVRGKAATLASLAYWEGERGNKTKQLELNLQTAQTLGKIQDYVNLRLVLKNLGVTDENKRIIYLAQAAWLCLRVQIPLIATVETLQSMYKLVAQCDEMQALLGTTAMYFCQIRGNEHPQLEELQQRSFNILAGAAAAQGIEPEAFETWMEQQQLNNPEYFIPRLGDRLEEIVGDEWLFQRF